MKYIRYALLLVIAILCFLETAPAQEETREPLFYVGIYGDLNINYHIADFDSLEGIPSCCTKFTSGKGYGISIGGLFELPIKQALNLDIRFGFATLNGTISKTDVIGRSIKLLSNGSIVEQNVTVQYNLDANFITAGIEPTIGFSFFENMNSRLGMRLAYLFTANVNMSEQLLSPDNVVFVETNNRSRNVVKGQEVPHKQPLQVFGVMAAGYELPLGKGAKLVPEIRFDIPFTDISDVSWRVATLELGVHAKIPIYPKKEIPVYRETIYNRDTTIIAVLGLKEEKVTLLNAKTESFMVTRKDSKIERDVITEHYQKEVPKEAPINSTIQAIGVYADGTRKENPSIVIEEIEMNESFPLLPQVFFKEGSANLQETSMHLITKQETEKFSPDSMQWNTLKIWSDLLNIIGYRMKKNPNTEITITGCNSNNGQEKNDLNLSQQRADALKQYLVDVWNIKAKRISVKKQNLPDNPSNSQEPDGQQENQRAEIASDDFDIVKPLDMKEVMRRINPPVVEITPTVNSTLDIKNWDLSIEQSGNNLRKYNGTTLQPMIKWNIEEKPIPQLEAPVDIKFDAMDAIGQKTNAQTNLTIQQLTISKKREEFKDDKKIERFSLIVFNFDKADITPQQKLILKEIKNHIKPNSQITIAGYTDRTGDREYNQFLAYRRSEEVQKALDISGDNIHLQSVGSDNLLYNNNLPEGRSYSRTVQIVVETPVE